MSKGRRYHQEKKKLNIKKVLAVLIAIAVIIMIVIGVQKLWNKGPKVEEKKVALEYFAAYSNNKWGVINSKGEVVISPEYDEAVIIPNNEQDIFLCTYNVDYSKNTYQTKVVNSKNQEVISGYDKIVPVENYDKNNNVWYENDVLIVSKNEKYGLVDFKGKELLPCEYDSITALKGTKNSIIIQKDKKYGLVDNIGAIVMAPEYDSISAVSVQSENGYIVKQNGKMGIIGSDKKAILETKYEDIKQLYGNGKYVVKENGKWEITDQEGKVYLQDKFEEVLDIHGENIIAKVKGKYGVLTLSGETKLATDYQEITHAFDNNYIVKKDSKYGVMNIAGETVVKLEYDKITYRADANFFEASKTNSSNTDFIDASFEIKLAGILSEINTTAGYMKIYTEGQYQYYNFKFEKKSNSELLKSNTLFLAKKDGKYGYVNKEGIVVVDYIYDDAREQNEFGYASVKKDGMWGCIDSKGKVAITPAYKLEYNSLIEFIGKWHRGEDLNLNYYTDK